jgi:hypothetical protein
LVSVTIFVYEYQMLTLHSADRGAEFVPAREWMRICFELLDLLKTHKKGIRRAAVNSFGYIAKSLGPQGLKTCSRSPKINEFCNPYLSKLTSNRYRMSK